MSFFTESYEAMLGGGQADTSKKKADQAAATAGASWWDSVTSTVAEATSIVEGKKKVEQPGKSWWGTVGAQVDEAITIAKQSPQAAATYYTDQLKAAGLQAGVKPSIKVLTAIKPTIGKLLSPGDACTILAWLGGAHDAADAQFAGVSSKLSAQETCGWQPSQAGGSLADWLGLGFSTQPAAASFRGVSEILAELGAKSADAKSAAALIKSAGAASAAKSAASQDKQAVDDAKKIAKEALAAVTPAGLGTSVSVGAGVAVAVIVGVLAYKLLK